MNVRGYDSFRVIAFCIIHVILTIIILANATLSFQGCLLRLLRFFEIIIAAIFIIEARAPLLVAAITRFLINRGIIIYSLSVGTQNIYC